MGRKRINPEEVKQKRSISMQKNVWEQLERKVGKGNLSKTIEYIVKKYFKMED